MGIIDVSKIELTTLQSLEIEAPDQIPQIPQCVYDERLDKLRECMEEETLDCVVFYADREHYSNF